MRSKFFTWEIREGEHRPKAKGKHKKTVDAAVEAGRAHARRLHGSDLRVIVKNAEGVVILVARVGPCSGERP